MFFCSLPVSRYGYTLLLPPPGYTTVQPVVQTEARGTPSQQDPREYVSILRGTLQQCITHLHRTSINAKLPESIAKPSPLDPTTSRPPECMSNHPGDPTTATVACLSHITRSEGEPEVVDEPVLSSVGSVYVCVSWRVSRPGLDQVRRTSFHRCEGMAEGEAGGRGCEACEVLPRLKYHYSPPPKPGFYESIKAKMKEMCSCSGGCVVSAVKARVPILSWLPNYDVRSSLLGDVVAGVTVGIVHIPQGMGFALLGELPPIAGIYMAFFPLLIYGLLATSRHSAMGSFGVICLMTGAVVQQFATTPSNVPVSSLDGNITEGLGANTTQMYTATQVAAVVALVNGIVQVVLGLLQLGSLCDFLSDMLVSGFTTAAAFHILTSQIKYLLGIQVNTYNGPLKIIYTYQEIFGQLLECNPAELIISSVTIVVLVASSDLLKPWLLTKTKIPVPIELIVVTVGTLASYLGDLHNTYNIRIVGDIPTGLPKPTLPPVELIPAVAVDSIVISIVALTVSFSMAKIFAKRHNYKVDATQELYAMGASNVFGSFFGCPPICTSLSRSLIQEAAGGVTQLANFICCSLLLFVLLFVAKLFETLPNSVLSSIIVVALRGMFLQVNDLRRVWAVSRVDAMMWITSFLGVVIIDIDYGLLLGIVVSILVLLGRSKQPKTARLGRVPNTHLYLDISKYSVATEIPMLRIFQFSGPLNFANSEYFRQQLVFLTGLDPSEMPATKAIQKPHQYEDNITTRLTKDVEWLVIEMSGISYTDSSGGTLISQLSKDFKRAGITLCLAALSESVLETLEVCGALKVIPTECIFHSVDEAVKTLTQSDPPPAASNGI
ncbi:prestin-like [Procambarus clarkii]|uniref:prestin-like n=1 Tax=Procambarus clarkii TaxID=6728 RepID=UPI00374436CC